MRSWLKKTGLLLWKNTLLTSRRPVSLLFEILIPLLIYVVLLVFRFVFPVEVVQDAAFRPVALPSAGFLPFMQSLACDLDAKPANHSSEMPYYPNANISKVYTLLGNGSLADVLDNNFCQSLQNFEHQLRCTNNLLQSLQQNNPSDGVRLGNLLENEESFESYLVNKLGLNQSVADAILNSMVHTDQSTTNPYYLLGLFGGVSDSISGQTLKYMVCNDTGLLDQLVTFNSPAERDQVVASLCSLNDSQWANLARTLQRQLSLDDCNNDTANFLESITFLQNMLSLLPSGSLFEIDSDTNSSYLEQFLCGDISSSPRDLQPLLFHLLYGDEAQQAARSGNYSEVFASQITPKILYTPDTPRTREIILRANRTFAAFGFMLNWAQQLENCSDYFLEHYSPSSPLVVQLRDATGAILASSQFLPIDRDAIQQLHDLLNPNRPGNIWELVQEVRDSAHTVASLISIVNWDIFYPMVSEAEMIEVSGSVARRKELGMSSVFAVVVFNDDIEREESLKRVSIKIRMNSSYVHVTNEYKEPVWYSGPENIFWKRRYLTAGFAFLQDMLERGSMEGIVGRRVAGPGAYVQEMPYPCYADDFFLVSIQWMLPFAMTLSWMLSVGMIVRGVVREKETRIKEVMRMMGVGRGQLWMSWFVTSLVTLTVSVIVITLIIKFGGFLTKSNGFIIFLFLMIYAIAIIHYCFLCSTFFTNANMGACVAALVYFLLFFAYVVVLKFLNQFHVAVTALLCLLPPVSFGIGSFYLVQYELLEVGQQFTNLMESPSPESSLSLGLILILMVVSCVLHEMVIWYIEAVFPGKYGVSKPLYFPFLPLLKLLQRLRSWKNSRALNDEELQMLSDGEAEEGDESVCEEEPQHLMKGIHISGLSKTYRTGLRGKVKALKKLNLSMYEGQITSFLGHNGAGKTTTMSLLTGLYEPTAGTAYIYGKDIRREMDSIRDSLGICPQHNVLFENLTVEEHVFFFGRMKGLTRRDVKAQLLDWLSKMNLSEHRYTRARHLSGGMQRKLSIMLAFIGHAQTVILDEPTSGIDPYARKQIWDFLSQLKEGRTIMLSTHHMDEAEILGDRIAIVSKGKLICSGSFDFLKGHFGRGHQLRIVVDDSDRRSTSLDPSSGQESIEDDIRNDTVITEFLKDFIPDATLILHKGRELHYLLPLQQSRPAVLQTLFEKLDKICTQLRIRNYGLTACSMEEIFIDLTRRELEVDQDVALERSATPPSEDTHDPELIINDRTETPPLSDDNDCFEVPVEVKRPRIKGISLWFYQYVALIVKRLHYTRRKPLAFLVQNVLPLAVIGMSLAIAHFILSVSDPPSLLLHPSLFFSFTGANYMLLRDGGNASKDYAGTLFHPCGIGAKYLEDPTNPDSMCYYDRPPDSCQGYSEPHFECSSYCDCRNRTTPPYNPQCYNGTVTGTRIQNLSGFDYKTFTSYLEYTKTQFVEERYGGVSFGLTHPDIPLSLDSTYNNDVNDSLPFLAVSEAAKAWHTYKGYHALPAYLNTLNNAIMRANLPPENASHAAEYGIQTYSHPFPTTYLQKLQIALEGASFLVNPLAAMFSLGFVASGFVLIIIEERSSKLLHLQLVCGMNRLVYWVTSFTWDLVGFTIFATLVLVLYAASMDENLAGTDNLMTIYALLLAYGAAVTPWTYVYSFLFSSSTTAYVMLFCWNFFSGFIVLLISAIIAVELDYNEHNIQFYLGALPIPSYVLARALMYFTLDRVFDEAYSDTFTYVDLPHPMTFAWKFIVAMLWHSVLGVVLLVVIEVFRMNRLWYNRTKSQPALGAEDKDITEERERVARGCTDCPLVIDNLTKVYSSRIVSLSQRKLRRIAVNQLSLGLNKGECFGLLGLNGAGKTTTFQMLTGDTATSLGNAIINGYSVKKNIRQAQQSIGYCPQFDALCGSLTGREHLILFSKLRGIPAAEIPKAVDEAIKMLELTPHADKPVSTYSGGNARRLSTAIALVGDPPVVMLDEPTSGIDPRARQFLWSVIKRIASKGHTVLLTTHSMVECEALCSRVGIMVNGALKCLGTPQQLKSKYGQGYRLNVRTGYGERRVADCKAFVEQKIPGAELKEEHMCTVVYQLPSGFPLHTVFSVMEDIRHTVDDEVSYSLSQTTLDDVFIYFVQEQNEDAGLDEVDSGSSVELQLVPSLDNNNDALPTELPHPRQESTL